MGRFNQYMNNHFRGCTLLAEAYDNCRHRDVKLHAMPGQLECVGVSDGTDAWIAPVSASLFSVNIERQMQDMNAGKLVVIRRPGVPVARRPLLIAEAQPTPRRRVVLADAEVQPRGRRALLG